MIAASLAEAFTLAALIVLDVDGTISRVYRDDEKAEHRHDRSWTATMPFNDEIIDALNEQAHRPGVAVAWLTSWPDIDWLVQRPLAGRLAGPYIPHINWPRRGWRTRSLITYLNQVRPQAVIWADDDAPGDASRRVRDATGIPALVVKPALHVGITSDDVTQITIFLDRRLSTRGPVRAAFRGVKDRD